MMEFFRRVVARLGGGRKGPEASATGEGLRVGGLYSVVSDEARQVFSVVKVLVLEPGVVHLRAYQNTFAGRPESIDPAALTLGGLDLNTLDDVDFETYRFGIGHMPLSLDDFVYDWRPGFLMEAPVTDEELEGYRYWKEAEGGVFGGLGQP